MIRSPRVHRAALLAVLVAALAGAALPGAATGAGLDAPRIEPRGLPSSPGDRPSVVILLGGLCSSLAAGALPPAFDGAGGLIERLRAEGWAPDEIVAFSYRGGIVDGAGRWLAQPYACEDTRDRPIATHTATLDAQVRAIVGARPGTDVHLVGFSQGGLIAVAYLAHLERSGSWALPNGGRLTTVVALDSPLGGLPFVEAACGLVGDVCASVGPGPTPPSLADMSTIWTSGTGRPAGSDRSIGRLYDRPLSNQSLARLAAEQHGVAVLTVGNVRDWVYAPIGLLRPVVNFTDTQWLRSEAAGSGVYARVIDSGPSSCPDDDPTGAGCNHDRVLRDTAVHQGIVTAFRGGTPAAAVSCPAGRGGCLTLQPRPAPTISSAIAPGVVTIGSRGFSTRLVRVPAGGRVTVLFTGGSALAGQRLEIWARTQSGVYTRVTSRIADATGSARYYAPPVKDWIAYQARYAGSLTLGAAVSPGRVADVR